MAYQANIPQGPDNPSISQGDILANFQELYTCIAVNHVPLSDGSGGQGKHNFCTFPEQVSSPATLVNEGAIYTKNNASSGKTDAYFRTESSGNEYQLNPIKAWCSFNGDIAGPAAPACGNNVSTVTRTATGTYTITFSQALPSANYGVVVNPHISSDPSQAGLVGGVDTKATNSCVVVVKNSTSSALANTNPIMVTVYQ